MGQQIERSSARQPELDGLRGLAIFAVLISHGVGLSGFFPLSSTSNRILAYFAVPLWGGVDLFFVLSGFLITSILLRAKASSHYFLYFYARRVLRIFPIYYFALTASLIFAGFSSFLSQGLPTGSATRLSYFVYLQNWPVFWHGAKIMGGIWGAYWSLAVEEQFYLIWPLVVRLLSERAIIRTCIIGIFAALPIRIFLEIHYFGGSFGLAQISVSRVDGLFAGAAIATYMKVNKRTVPEMLIAIMGTIGLGILGYIGIWHPTEFLGTDKWMTTVGISAFALISAALLAASQSGEPAIYRLLIIRPLRVLGKYSYGIYVYHLFVFLFVRHYLVDPASLSSRLSFLERLILLSIECTSILLLAKISYELFELKFLRLKRFFEVGNTSQIQVQSSS